MAAHVGSIELSTQEIIAYTDSQLDEYLKANGRIVTVKDPENLMKAEGFLDRLRARVVQPLSAPPDAQELASRLLKVSAYETGLAHPPASPTATPPTEEERYLEAKHYEIEAYHHLVNSGGRPSHPLERMEDIVKDPGELREILSFWQGEFGREDKWDVYMPQSGRWSNFKRIQRHFRVGRFKNTSDLLGAEDCGTWEEFAHECPNLVKNGTRGFPEYAQSMQKRLTRHGITATFQLKQDIAQQDKLTTWIEFLHWEYMWFDHYTLIYRRRSRHYNTAWTRLVESGVLRPGETDDIICDSRHAFQRAIEGRDAEMAAEQAKSNLQAAEQAIAASKPSPSQSKMRILRQLVDAAHATLESASKTHTSIKRRNNLIGDFVLGTRTYQIAKVNADRHTMLLRWIAQQIPQIEKELNLTPPTTPLTPVVAEPKPQFTTHSKPEHSQLERTTTEETPERQTFYQSRSSGKRRREHQDDGMRSTKRAKLTSNASTKVTGQEIKSLNDQHSCEVTTRFDTNQYSHVDSSTEIDGNCVSSTIRKRGGNHDPVRTRRRTGNTSHLPEPSQAYPRRSARIAARTASIRSNVDRQISANARNERSLKKSSNMNHVQKTKRRSRRRKEAGNMFGKAKQILDISSGALQT